MPFNITSFSIGPLEETHFVKPVRISYMQNGKARSWEAVQSHDSVSVLLYHREKASFLLVKQFRPPVFMNDENYPVTYELCAGIVDKKSSLMQIAKEEIDEECGYDVPIERIEKITSFFTNVGVSGSRQHLFYAEIDESMKEHDGGGIETEEIILEWIPLSEARSFVYDESKAKTPGLMFAFYWFFEQHEEGA
ncbi:MAG: NUDIX hydrolase [Campylobacterota bacterium]|nr:NUDIX hydrolase [Campylobacterota bacterium]